MCAKYTNPKKWIDDGRIREFTLTELRIFADYSWHVVQGMKADIMDLSRETSALKRENEKLKRTKTSENS